jgi:hypothetical protein
VRKYRGVFKQALNAYLYEFLDYISDVDQTHELIVASERKLQDTHIRKAFYYLYENVGKSYAQTTFKNLSVKAAKQGIELKYKEPSIDYNAIWSRRIIEQVNHKFGKRITLITETTEKIFKKIVNETVENGIKDGISVKDMAKIIKDQIGFTDTYRAERIARTEVISASNMGSLEGAKATGLNINKQWLSTKDDKVRGLGMNDEFDHINCDGESVGMNDAFLQTGEELEFPGDPTGSSGNVINCRCTIVYDTSAEDAAFDEQFGTE